MAVYREWLMGHRNDPKVRAQRAAWGPAMVQWPAWEASMRRRGLAEGTIVKRRGELAAWAAWIGQQWPHAEHGDVEQWLDARPLGARARASAVSHLSAFYKWARRQGLVAVDPTVDVERPRLRPGFPRPASSAAVARLVSGGDEVAVAGALMAYGGLRCAEVAGLDLADVDHDRGVIFVTGKGGKQAFVFMSPALREVLRRAPRSGPVLGRKVSPARMSQIVCKRLRELGSRDTAHQLRHWSGTELLVHSGDVEVVRQHLRHASIATTQVYAQASGERVRKVVAGWHTNGLPHTVAVPQEKAL